jgi:hypothetical protein
VAFTAFIRADFTFQQSLPLRVRREKGLYSRTQAIKLAGIAIMVSMEGHHISVFALFLAGLCVEHDVEICGFRHGFT